MRLTKKHIGQLFDIDHGDGSWLYQLMDVKDGKLLFYSFSATGYEIEPQNKYDDWRPFNPQTWWSKAHVKMGWNIAKRTK